MIDLDRFVQQVQRNCDISDAHHSGIFSICGLALRLRDLYKWEHALAPWEEGDPAGVLEWIGIREGYWETLSGAEVGPLAWGGRRIDPFDTEAVNSALAPHRLYYGAGYARGLKPTFFLAAIESQQEIQGCRVVRLGRELARDLLTLPALSQGNRIILRRDAARGVLWDQIAYIPPSGRKLLDAALTACGISPRRPSDLREKWDGLLALQETIHFHHELGEIKESDFERNRWQEIVAAFALTRVELLARHVKDLLADTHPVGPLAHLCRTRNAAGLGLYLAFVDRLTCNLFPQLLPAADAFLETGDWALIERAVAVGRAGAKHHADTIITAYVEAQSRQDLAQVEADVERHFGRHLGGEP